MILMSTAGGFTSRAMATFGSLIRKQRGPHTRQEDGSGSHITAGPGCLMSRGDGRLTITGGGFIMAILGAGGRDRSMCTTVRCGLRHSSSLSASDIIPALALAPSDGFPWARMIRFIRGTDAASIA